MKLKSFNIDVFEALELAEQKYPVRWYQKKATFLLLSIFVGTALTVLQWLRLHILFNWVLSFVGVSGYIFGAIVDNYSTCKVVALKSEFDRRKLEFPVVETNPFLPDHPAPHELFSGKGIFLEILFTVVVSVLGLGAAGIGIIRILAAINNFQYEKRLKVILKIADGGVIGLVDKDCREAKEGETVRLAIV